MRNFLSQKVFFPSGLEILDVMDAVLHRWEEEYDKEVYVGHVLLNNTPYMVVSRHTVRETMWWDIMTQWRWKECDLKYRLYHYRKRTGKNIQILVTEYR